METEVKLEVSELESIRARLQALGAVLEGSVEEENIYLDHEGRLAARDESLRLRRDNGVHLTWKGPSSFEQGIVQRPEIEVTVSSFADALAILQRAGFVITDQIHKHRETWRWQDVEISLDILDFGTFIELEGPPAGIRSLAAALGLDARRGIAASYRALARERRGRPGDTSQSKPASG